MISPETKSSRVLIIDDELGPRESLRILLKKQYEVICADSVHKGLELLQEKHPDVIVSDIRMPGVNGIEGLRMIREIDPFVPVIMLTGYGALETAQEAIRHGANDYMKKPFDANEMLAVIKRNVDRAEVIQRRENNRRTLEEMNQQLMDDISSKNRLASMGQASAELVHDLRNPMMIVLGYIQMLSQDLNEGQGQNVSIPHEAAEYMDVIEQNVRRCKDLIESWLDLSRNNQMALKPVNLADLIRETVEHTKPQAFAKSAVVECSVPSHSIAILGHAIQLKRALQNLIGNAVDALHGEAGRIVVSCRKNENQYEVSIADNGAGIEEKHLPHIFKPFYSSKAPGEGTGLGLFITQKIIEDHHGSIEIDSAHGKGTIALLRFPALEESAAIG